jgi:hypothetical protein
MLTEIEKERIKLEEHLRFEIRTQLEKTNAKQVHPAVNFLNTNLGIFLLSSIFLSSFSWVYNEYKTNKDLRIKNQQEQTFLHYEIHQRYNVVEQLADTISEDTKKDVVGAVRGGFSYSIRKDYRDLSFSALLVKYETLSENHNTISLQVQDATRLLNHFELYEDQLQLVQGFNRKHTLENYYFLSPTVRKDFRRHFLNKLIRFQ